MCRFSLYCCNENEYVGFLQEVTKITKLMLCGLVLGAGALLNFAWIYRMHLGLSQTTAYENFEHPVYPCNYFIKNIGTPASFSSFSLVQNDHSQMCVQD